MLSYETFALTIKIKKGIDGKPEESVLYLDKFLHSNASKNSKKTKFPESD